MARTSFELKGKTVFVAGHGRMVGAALVRRLAQEKSRAAHRRAPRGQPARPGRRVRLVCRPQAVFMAAAKK